MRRLAQRGMGTDSTPGVIPLIHHIDSPCISYPMRTGRGLAITEWSPFIWHFKPICIWYGNEVDAAEVACGLCCHYSGKLITCPIRLTGGTDQHRDYDHNLSIISVASFSLRGTDCEPVIRASKSMIFDQVELFLVSSLRILDQVCHLGNSELDPYVIFSFKKLQFICFLL